MSIEACQAKKEQRDMGFKGGRTTRNRWALADMMAPYHGQRNHGRYVQKLAR